MIRAGRGKPDYAWDDEQIDKGRGVGSVDGVQQGVLSSETCFDC